MRLAELRRRCGRRGAFLACMAAYDLAYGAFLAAGGQLQHVPLLPTRTWGWLWLADGIILASGILMRHDWPFYAAAIGIKMVWAAEYFRLEWFAHVPLDWLRGCYWLALAAAVFVAAGWPESAPPQPPAVSPSDAERRARDT